MALYNAKLYERNSLSIRLDKVVCDDGVWYVLCCVMVYDMTVYDKMLNTVVIDYVVACSVNNGTMYSKY